MARNTGTDYGSTRVNYALKCPKMYALYLQHGFGASTPAQQVGTVVHHLLCSYHGDAGTICPIPEDCDETSWVIGRKIADKYKERVTTSQWGHFLAAEQEMIVRSEDSATVSLTQWPMLTGRADLIVTVDDTISAWYMQQYNIYLPNGDYIVDYKTAGRKDAWYMESLVNGLQPLHYAWLWTQLHQDRDPVRGAIILELYHYKGELKEVNPYAKVFDWQLTDAPRFKRMCEAIGEVEAKIKLVGALGNPGACQGGKYDCGMIKKGLCKGY